MKFSELELHDSLMEAISYMGFEEATPIQAESIPPILDYKDVLACAQTGTGKTVAFVLPILDKLIGKQDYSIDTLIIVPTRELAIQIEQQIQALSYFVSATSLPIYGGGDGSDWNQQKKALKMGCDIIVATPGKLLSHLKQGYVNLDKLQHFVLDEADRMLDMGFVDDIMKIKSYIPNDHQTLLFSATMPAGIAKLAKNILYKPTEITLGLSKPAEGVDQKAILCHNEQKIGVIQHLLSEREDYDSILIFTSTKSMVSEIVKGLRKVNIAAKWISSDLNQSDREEVLIGFRSKRTRILVATDVLSRGIDIKEIRLVINFDAPQDAEDYVHRIGRTARADASGEAITLVNTQDMVRVAKIEKLIEQNIPKENVPAHLGESPAWKKPRPQNARKKHYSKNKKGGTNQNNKGRYKPRNKSQKPR